VLEIDKKLLLEGLKPVDEAAHDAAGHASACLKGTRTDLLEDIAVWMSDPKAKQMYWLSGMAGSGKSAISQNVAAMAETQGSLAASFFFSRTSAERQRASAVIPTIAYQLALSHAVLRPRVYAAAASQPRIRSLETAKQAEVLLSTALADVSHEFPAPLIIVLDALDECEKDSKMGCEGGDLIPALLGAVQGLQFPVKVFVTSRPESSIIKMFGGAGVSSSAARLALHQDIEEEVIRHDIRLYLRHELDQIARDHSILAPFPSSEAFHLLVQRADTLFIYFRTIVGYIASPIGEPSEQLAELLDSGATSSPEQYAHLDALYHQILIKAHRTFGRSTAATRQFRDVLAYLVFLKQSVNVSTLASFANIAEPLCKKIIRSLSSVLLCDLESVAEPVRLMHPSLANYLTDQGRCNDVNYHVGNDVKSRLAASIMQRYIDTEDAHLLDEVVNLDSGAIRLAVCPDADKERATSCMSLANALRDRYNQIGQVGMLEEAVGLGREAVGLCSSGHPYRADSCVNLGKSLRTQYEQSGEAALLQEAIILQREALSLCPTGHPTRAASCGNLANSLGTQYQQSGEAALLHEAITLQREALSLCPTGHPNRALWCGNLANSLSTQYEQSGEAALLQEAITLQREALGLRPTGHPNRAVSCGNLANSLETQYEQSGEAALLQEVITLQREALGLCPTGHPKRAVSCGNLASSLWTQYEQSGEAALLQEAITLQREALGLCPTGHPKRAVSCGNLAYSLWTQYRQTGEASLLQEAITLQREALGLCPTGHTNHAHWCTNLAISLWTQYKQSGEAALLHETIALEREALSLRPAGHPDRALSYGNLAFYLRLQYKITAAAELLPEALTLEQEAATLKARRTSHAQDAAIICTEHITQRTNIDL
jgi:DNA-directed RNA polymerase subunit N (RpoN/RPB10)